MADMIKFAIANWSEFQHFKDRDPIWLKLYRELRNKREWRQLDPAPAKALVDIWLLASEQKQPGVIHMTTEDLAWELRADPIDVSEWLQALESLGFINTVSERYQPDIPHALAREEKEIEKEIEKRREERERTDGLSVMLEKYPDAGTALDAMKHRSRQATDATLRMGFLYADGGGMPDPSVKGETSERRCRLVAAALLELAGQGETDWNPRLLAGYLRRIRKQPDSTSEAASVKDGDPQWIATKAKALSEEQAAISALNLASVPKMPTKGNNEEGRAKKKALGDLARVRAAQ